MTTTEAIKQLQTEHDLIAGERELDGSQLAPALLEALAMAIEVMQGDGDTISRKAAIDAIFSEPLYESGMKKRDADAVVPAIYEKIKSLPSAQPERENGKWIVNETLINCSVCKHSAWSRHAFEDIVRGFNFCPNCGKPMKRGKQDEIDNPDEKN